MSTNKTNSALLNDRSNEFISYNNINNNRLQSPSFADDYSNYDLLYNDNNDNNEFDRFMGSYPDIESDNVTEAIRLEGNGSSLESLTGLTDRRLSNNSEFDFRIDNETDFSWLADYNISELEPSELFFPSLFSSILWFTSNFNLSRNG